MSHRSILYFLALLSLLGACAVDSSATSTMPIEMTPEVTPVPGVHQWHFEQRVSPVPEGAHRWVDMTQITQNRGFVDNSHTRWFATDGGLVAFEEGRERPRVYTALNSGLPDTFVTSLAIDGQGRLWLGTGEGHIARYDRQAEAWIVYFEVTHAPPRSSKAVTKLAIGPDDAVWAVVPEGILAGHGGLWTLHTKDNSRFPGGHVTSITPGDKGQTWIATEPVEYLVDFMGTMLVEGGGLAHFDGQTWTVSPDGAGGPTAENIGKDESARVNPLTWAEVIAATPLNDRVLGVHPAPGGSVFLTFSRDRALHFDGKAWHERPYPLVDDFRFGLAAVAVDSKGKLWVAFNLGYLRIYEGDQWRDERFPPEAGPYVRGMAFDADGRLYLSGDEGGLFIRENDGSWTRMMHETGAIARNPALESSHLWVVGAEARSLILHDGQHDFKAIELAPGKYPRLGHPVVDTRGRAWIHQGASAPDPLSRVVIYDVDGTYRELGENADIALLGSSRGDYIWVRNGLSRVGRLDLDTFEFEPLELPPVPGARFAVEDEGGGLWIGHARGVIRYDLATPP